jgi:3-oxoacyl-[acyl-carrier-protein] synthase-1/3-oxoacyl-[acyl-carrier-protein] synthase II
MQSLFAGRPSPKPPTRFSAEHPTDYPVFEVPDTVHLSESSRQPDIMLTARLGLTATREALDSAGWNREMLRNKRVGVCIGTTVGSAMNNEAFYREYRSGKHPRMDAITRFLNSNPAQVIAREHDFNGPCQTVVNACSSGTDAIGIGASWIRSGLCDVVFAGGTDELCRVTYNGFISLMITDDEPCKPFDAERKGLNLGEGAAILVLEADALCRSRKHQPRTLVTGYGSACDAYHLTAPAPDGKGLKQALASAMAECNLNIADVAFINAHGTGTRDNDRTESQVFDELLPGVPFLSTKGYTGHTLGAAGAVEAAFTIACLEADKIPASAGLKTPDPELPVTPVQNETVTQGRFAVSQSLAFGGNNGVLIFGKGDL